MPPEYEVVSASKPRQSAILPEGTVAFLIAANTCQAVFPVELSGQAMKPSAPKLLVVNLPVGEPLIHSKGPCWDPLGMEMECGLV